MFNRPMSAKSRHSKDSAETLNQPQRNIEMRGLFDAVNRVQAIIQFAMDGSIITANEIFLRLMGYRLDEIQGKHHRIFAEPVYAQSATYREFWARLGRGEGDAGEYLRLGKGGKEVWLLASYNPIFDDSGKPFKVVKFATDVTEEKLRNADFQGQMTALAKVQGTIEFNMKGEIQKANRMFLDLVGYSLEEIKGKHHSMFLLPGEEHSEAYREFWRSLREGKPDSRVFKRLAKNGKPVWLRASYNPIPDMKGRPYKVVKFATDLTQLITSTEMTQQSATSMAAATEQLTASIAEISRNMAISREATGKIRETAIGSGTQAETLLDSMKAMERIVGLIRGIAQRVNMLSLNATIEAARAGEAGKGFAVVASEVKSLSNQTAKATDEISREIGAVQEISSKVAESIRLTAEETGEVDQYVAGVSVAMEEQKAVVREISDRSSQMARAVESILEEATRVNR